ncbi:Thiol-disulfide isomerase or thioredoxin [bacterium A37T11]|nr:Thiol-disulfide isomerase or thioredoxin [bacterium A37T11]
MVSLAAQPVFCQQEKALHVGDQMPNFTFPTVMNGPKKTIPLNSLNGKLVLLDFWFSGCGGCIRLMPHMQELQNHFGNKIQIILVNSLKSDNETKIDGILQRVKKDTGVSIRLPVTVYDSTINQFFPAKGYPHEVILAPNGKIIAITGAESITQENIQSLLDGKQVAMPLKYDFWNRNVPEVSTFNTTSTQGILTSSSITKLPIGAEGGSNPKYDENNKQIGSRISFHIPEAYQMVYPAIFKNEPLVLFEGIDSVNSLHQVYVYDYIDQTQAFLENRWLTSLRQDLDKTFGYSLKKVRKLVPCLIVRTNAKIANSYTKYSEGADNLPSISKNYRVAVYVHNRDLSNIIPYFPLKFFGAQKLIDKTTDKNPIDLEFPLGFDFRNTAHFMEFMHEKGIDLSVEKREVDCVVILCSSSANLL